MSEARKIIEKCFNAHPKSQRFLVDSLEKALLAYGQQEREKAIRECGAIATEMWLGTYRLPGGKEPVHNYLGSVQEKLREMLKTTEGKS